MPLVYGATKELNMLIVWGTETHLALQASGARGPTTAFINDHIKYEPPANKEVTKRMRKSPNSNSMIKDTLQEAIARASA